MSLSPDFRPSTRHAQLGEAFYDVVKPASFPERRLRFRNERWAARVGLDGLTEAEWLDHFGRFAPLPGSFPQPLALRYHGHQFGVYNPDLGDGRGFLFAQVHDLHDGRLLDLGTKGSGRTPWSRMGDGRLTLNGGIREVLATEMLEAQGVNTSKSFSLIETGEDLDRGDEPSPTRSAVLTRLSHSHIRIGTFQRFLALDEPDNIRRLLDYVIETYWPGLAPLPAAERPTAFLEALGGVTARMGAQWMVAGFVHGVLNTDNINVTGESFDYGPWRFLPTHDAGFTAAYFDHAGRYAYGRQPSVLLWNLCRLGECLLPLAPQAAIEAALGAFAPTFRQAFVEETMRRLGLELEGGEADTRLTETFWTFLRDSQAPFEQAFFDLYGGEASAARRARSPAAEAYSGDAFAAFGTMLAAARSRPNLRLDHAYFAAPEPCAMVHAEVETILGAIAAGDDWAPFHAKLAHIAQMRKAYGTETAALPT
ncbi:MAG TPA: YdiU family protein [Lichenihabitans sp.]|jgi:uncharacterized protein YdiU (UPF0061 family)|nr:YdiU family protein [Lichenihabitans sp.]